MAKDGIKETETQSVSRSWRSNLNKINSSCIRGFCILKQLYRGFILLTQCNEQSVLSRPWMCQFLCNLKDTVINDYSRRRSLPKLSHPAWLVTFTLLEVCRNMLISWIVSRSNATYIRILYIRNGIRGGRNSVVNVWYTQCPLPLAVVLPFCSIQLRPLH